MEKRFEILELPPDARQLVAECEVNGARTLFERNGRTVAILVSYDEYLALRETIDIGHNAELRRQIEIAENETARGAMIAVEDLIREPMWNDRLRIAESVLPQWNALNDADRAAVLGALELIDEDPIAGAPLYEPLRGTWSMDAGGLRIVYRIVAQGRFVAILSLGRR